MILSRTTLAIGAAVVLMALLLVVPSRSPMDGAGLPALPSVKRDDVTRLTFTRRGVTTVIQREDDRWMLKQPLQAEADLAAVKALLLAFRKAVPMDARIDTGNHADYGLDANNGVHFELFTGQDDPHISMVVGLDVPGGSTLVRLAGDDDVYRARVAGRHRYDREPADWRNKRIVNLEADLVAALEISRPGGELHLYREADPVEEGEARIYSPWRFSEGPAFEVDQKTVESLVDSLAFLRSSEIHSPDYGDGWEQPAATVRILTVDGGEAKLSFVLAPDRQSALARRSTEGTEGEVFRVARPHLDRLLQPAALFQDRTIFTFDIDQVDSLVLEQGSTRVRLQQDLGTHLWRVVEPVAMDADLTRVAAAVHALRNLRALRVLPITPDAGGFGPNTTRIGARFLDGSSATLEVGAMVPGEDPKAYHVRRLGEDTVYALDTDTIAKLLQAFMRS